MAIFGPKPSVNAFGKMSIFYSLERFFFFLEYRKRHFPGLYCLKKNVGKKGIFRPKPWVNPFGKISNVRLFELFFYSLKRRFFVLECRKTHFPRVHCLKKKLEKWPFLEQNHGLTPLEKCLFFDFLTFLFL